MIRTLAAVLLAAHGLIHLIGFVTPWRIAALEGFTYRTTVLNGGLDVGEMGVRLIGMVWLSLAVGFVAAAYGVWRRARWAPGLAAVLASVSLVMCILGLPETFAGVAINVAILAIVAHAAVLRPSRSH